MYHALNPKLTVIVPDVSHWGFFFTANIIQTLFNLAEFLVQQSTAVIHYVSEVLSQQNYICNRRTVSMHCFKINVESFRSDSYVILTV